MAPPRSHLRIAPALLAVSIGGWADDAQRHNHSGTGEPGRDDYAEEVAVSEETRSSDFVVPHFHAQAALGATTADDVEDFASNHHDPATDGFSLQTLEAGLFLKAGDHLLGCGVVNLNYDEHTSKWSLELEECHAQVDELPGNLSLRGGRFLSRLGLHNSQHAHAWDWVNAPLAAGRFEGLGREA